MKGTFKYLKRTTIEPSINLSIDPENKNTSSKLSPRINPSAPPMSIKRSLITLAPSQYTF